MSMLSIFEEDITELFDDIVFNYDIVSDTMYLFGENRHCIPLTDKTEHFIDYIRKGELLDEESQEEVLKLYQRFRFDEPIFQLRIQIKNLSNEYEYYNVKGKFRKKEKVIRGILKNVNLEITTLESLEEKAFIDPLTKIYNRNGLEENLNGKMKTVGSPYLGAMFLIDLDNFKSINDSMGHLLGDALLIEIAQAIQTVFPKHAVISRIGGDEFLVFAYRETCREVYEQKARQLCEKVEASYSSKDSKYQITLSIGIALCRNEEEFNQIFNHADIALYKAKTSGKNCYHFYEEGMKLLPCNYIKTEEKEVIADRIESNGFTLLKLLVDQTIEIVNEEIVLERAIELILKSIIKSLDVKHAYVYCYNEEMRQIGTAFHGLEKKVYVTSFENNNVWVCHQNHFNRDGIFCCTDIERLEPKIRDEIKLRGIASILQVLIKRKGKVIGILGVADSNKKRFWTQDEVNALHTIGKVLASNVYNILNIVLDGNEDID